MKWINFVWGPRAGIIIALFVSFIERLRSRFFRPNGNRQKSIQMLPNPRIPSLGSEGQGLKPRPREPEGQRTWSQTEPTESPRARPPRS